MKGYRFQIPGSRQIWLRIAPSTFCSLVTGHVLDQRTRAINGQLFNLNNYFFNSSRSPLVLATRLIDRIQHSIENWTLTCSTTNTVYSSNWFCSIGWIALRKILRCEVRSRKGTIKAILWRARHSGSGDQWPPRLSSECLASNWLNLISSTCAFLYLPTEE